MPHASPFASDQEVAYSGRTVWDDVRMIFGEATPNEVLLVVIFFFCIVSFTWAPRVGEALGGLFTSDEE